MLPRMLYHRHSVGPALRWPRAQQATAGRTQQYDVYHELYLRRESARDIPDRSRQLWKQQSQPSFLSQSDPTQSFGYMSAIWDQHPTTRLEAARHVSGLLRARPCTAACQ